MDESKIIIELTSKIKTDLQYYGVNKLHLSMEIQIKSMAIIDIAMEDYVLNLLHKGKSE